MGKVSKKRFKCGHRGFGQHCHRCDFAEHLEKLVESSEKYVSHKKPNKSTGKIQQKVWSLQEMREEATRLAKEGKR
jgi:hypothetical protein